MSTGPEKERDQGPIGSTVVPRAKDLPPFGDLSPLIRQAYETFRRDLRQLIEEQPGHWVAYHGTRRIGVAPTKTELYQECFRQGLGRGEFLVRSIEPELGEVVIGPGIPEDIMPGRQG